MVGVFQQAATLGGVPIYEFACPKCRKIFSFLSKRIQPDRTPACPQCGSKRLDKQVSRFALSKGAKEPGAAGDAAAEVPDFDDPRVATAMSEIERDMEHLDENNPKHMAHVMRKMKEVLPQGAMPKEMDMAIKRLEQGEDPEKIEADMGEMLAPPGEGGGAAAPYEKDAGLYDY